MANSNSILLVLLSLFIHISSYKKNNDCTPVPKVPPDFKMSYGYSFFYLQNQSADYIFKTLSFQYSGFPKGREMEQITAAIIFSDHCI